MRLNAEWRIRSAEYDRIHARFGKLLRQHRRTAAEDRLMDLLGLLIEDYDRKHGMPAENMTPAEALQFLVEHSGKPANELLAPVFGQRSHVHEALTGRRPSSAAQARKLGQIFRVTGLFAS